MAIKRVPPADNEFLAGLESKSKKPNGFFRVMANRPEVLTQFVPLYGSIMGHGPVPRRTKELVYLAVAMTNRCAFCTSAHKAGALRAGISEEEIRALEAEQDSALSADEQAALSYARELTRTATATGAVRQALAAHFNDEQIVELTLVAALANFTNRFNNGLEILPDAT